MRQGREGVPGDRERSYSWGDPALTVAAAGEMDGLAFLEGLRDGAYPAPPFLSTIGLNLTTVPKALIECGNMRNATDAALLTSTPFQEQIARALEAAIIRFLS